MAKLKVVFFVTALAACNLSRGYKNDFIVHHYG